MLLFHLAKKFVFIVISCYEGKKQLPDGRNVHLSIKNPKEWEKIISGDLLIKPGIRINKPELLFTKIEDSEIEFQIGKLK